MLSRCFLNFSLGVGAFVIGLSRSSFFFSLYMSYHDKDTAIHTYTCIQPFRMSLVSVSVNDTSFSL